jgi:pre-mRNA-splicing factor ATP-dependent RNA helicase DHX15/PRP43
MKQVVGLHPSCGLDTQPEWVLFNEFVLTTRPFIRTVTEVRPEWYVTCLLSVIRLYACLCFRLLEFSGNYFEIPSFPEGETKRALQRVVNKLSGKATGKGIKRLSTGGDEADDKREKKKRKKT